MSQYQTDFYDSRPATSRTSKKPLFKLCFARNQPVGKSSACVSKMNVDFITPKFYSRQLEDASWNAGVSDTIEKIAAEENKDPRDMYRLPLLTSHTYGWWHDKGIQLKDPRINFHKRTSDLVSTQMKIYAEDKKLKDFKRCGEIKREVYHKC